jgi:hypothetical protein
MRTFLKIDRVCMKNPIKKSIKGGLSKDFFWRASFVRFPLSKLVLTQFQSMEFQPGWERLERRNSDVAPFDSTH